MARLWGNAPRPLFFLSDSPRSALPPRLFSFVAIAQAGLPLDDGCSSEFSHEEINKPRPDHAASTTATAVDCVAEHLGKQRNQPELRFLKRYHTHPDYIGPLAAQIRRYWDEHGKPERLLLSFHGLPRRCVELGDPYYRDCRETADALRAALDEPAVEVHMAFQSRFGAQRWLEPYTEPTLREWGKQGVGRVDAVCPGFLADCLETLEEIQVECRDAFLEEGGREFHYIPCLNDDPYERAEKKRYKINGTFI